MKKLTHKHYLIYKITNQINSNIYIGLHRTDNINDGYMGSGDKIWAAYNKHGVENFIKEILFDFDSIEDMINKEREIVNEKFIKRKDTYNIALGGRGGMWVTTVGTVSVIDKNGKTFRVPKNDPRLLTHELVGVTKGKHHAKTKEGKIIMAYYNDPRFKTGELTKHWCGKSGHKMSKETKEKQSNIRKGKSFCKWVCNDITGESKYIKKSSKIPNGFRLGRILKNRRPHTKETLKKLSDARKGKIMGNWYHNPNTKHETITDKIPTGYIKGRLPKNH